MEFQLEERLRRPMPMDPARKGGDDAGPAKPDVPRPDTRKLLERMKRIDPNTARRYRQRSGE
jgi:hypothetical protein